MYIEEKKKNKVKISIVLATYNGEKYITNQLDSLRLQTRQADEVIILDDVSSDNTVELVKKYIETYSLNGWKLFVNKENKGWRRNFYEGICKADGDLIFPCDQDDYWIQTKIEIMERIMTDNENIELLVSSYKIDGKYNKRDLSFCKESVKPVRKKDNIFKVPYPGCTYCIRKELVNKIKQYWKDSFPHDAFIWRMTLLSNTLYYYNKNLIIWRMHNDSSFSKEKSSPKTIEKKIEWINYANENIKAIRNFLNDNGILDGVNYKILECNTIWLNLRKKLFLTKKLIYWIYLLRYINIYPNKKQFLYDLYYIMK